MKNAEPVVLTDVEKRLIRILKWCNIFPALSAILIFVLILLPGPIEQISWEFIYIASLPAITAFCLKGCISGIYIIDVGISQERCSEFKSFLTVMRVFSLFTLTLGTSSFFAGRSSDMLRFLPAYFAPFAGLVSYLIGLYIGRRRISHLP